MYRLLIADDEHILLKGLSEHIPWGDIGCEVVATARNGHDAIESIRENPPDIVITDIKMPRRSGIEVARFISENCPQVKVIILTGFAEFEYAREAIAYGVAEYALKPVSKDSLMESVKKLIAAIEEEGGREKRDDDPMSRYVGKLYDIEKQITDRDFDAGRRTLASLHEELNALVSQKRGYSPVVEKTLKYIHENYNADLPLETVAAQIPVNPSHLSRTFKKEVGMTGTDYVNRIRVEKAKELLSFTDMLAYEVAEAVGFKDATYFSYVFKKLTGVSPTDYRKG